MFSKIKKAASVPSEETQYIQGCFNRLEDRLNKDTLYVTEGFIKLIDEIETIKDELIVLQNTQTEILSLLHKLPTLQWILQQEQKTKIEDKLDDNVFNLNVSKRTDNLLYNENIITVRDLVIKTEHELIRMPNIGRKAINEIKHALKELGLTLGMKL